MGRRFGNILETVGNTPVVRINRLAPAGSNLFVKIEAFNPLGSVKDRLAVGVIEALNSMTPQSPEFETEVLRPLRDLLKLKPSPCPVCGLPIPRRPSVEKC